MAVVGEFDPESFVGLDRGPGDEDRRRAREAIRSLNPAWAQPERAMDFAEARWRPDLIAGDSELLHLALSGEIPQALMRRMRAARSCGYEISVGVGSTNIDVRALLALQDIDARIIWVDWEDEAGSARAYRSIADWIATERISLSPSDLQLVAGARLDAALANEAAAKGRMFEEVLCLLFSQVSWFTVDEHAYRNESEEIDLILGIHATGHVAALAKGAVGIATAKNEKSATGSSTVKYLKEQVANRKDRCKLGFLCSASTISKDAGIEILRGSQSSDLVLVQIELSDLRDLLADTRNLDLGFLGLMQRAVNS